MFFYWFLVFFENRSTGLCVYPHNTYLPKTKDTTNKTKYTPKNGEKQTKSILPNNLITRNNTLKYQNIKTASEKNKLMVFPTQNFFY